MDVGSTLTGPTRSDGQTIVAAATLLAVGAVVLSVAHPQFESDTIDLAAGVDEALRCFDTGKRPCPGVGAYSLQQTAIVAAAKIAGFAPLTIGRLLTTISGLSFAVVVMFFTRGSPSTLRRLSLAALAAGPLVYYVRSTFGEMLATAALVTFVAAVRARRAHEWHGLAIIVAAAWSASLGKDTLPAFVFLFGFVTVALERRLVEGLDEACCSGKRRSVRRDDLLRVSPLPCRRLGQHRLRRSPRVLPRQGR